MRYAVMGSADGPTAIFIAGHFDDLFLALALLIMVLFYAIYFIKMFAQKRRGIQTRQLGKGKEMNIRIVEILLSAATFVIVPVQLFSLFSGWNVSPNGVRIAGSIIGFAGDIIFLISVVTMKDSWRAGIPKEDETELVSVGIYKYSRNPAFLGFDSMYMGILCMYFNWVLLPVTLWVIIMLHLQILQEERFLALKFGEEYRKYKERTSRYFGRKK